MMKHSRQREYIQQNLASRYDHPTAEMVYLSIKEDLPNISLGTVYRNLSLLADLGEILKISTPNGPDRFDGHTQPHYHVLCRSCGNVLDLDFHPDINLNQQANEHFEGQIEDFNLQFVGICADCLGKATK